MNDLDRFEHDLPVRPDIEKCVHEWVKDLKNPHLCGCRKCGIESW